MIDRLSRLIRRTSPEGDSDEARRRLDVGVVPLVLLATLGVTLIVLGSGLFRTKDRGQPRSIEEGGPLLPTENVDSAGDYASALERSLEAALSQMRGVGSVSVIVTLDADARMVYATIRSDDKEQVEERDSGGGTRSTTRSKVTEEPVITRTAGGGEEIVLVGSEPPKVRGVLVVADGARSPEMKLEIAQAVSAVLGIALHRVAVVEREV